MKKLITITILCVLINTNAYSKHSKHKPDSTTALKTEVTDLQSKISQSNNIFNFLIDLFLPNYGEYKEVKRTAPPYTFFDNGNISDLRETIRGNILNKKDNFFDIYLQLFKLISSSPTCSEDAICKEALIAKCAAFVYFVGYEFDVNENLVNLGVVGSSNREAYYNIALSKLKAANIESGRFGSWNWETAIDKQRYRAFELIEYLQAYDYIYTTRFHLNPNDFNTISFETDKYDIREKLAEFTLLCVVLCARHWQRRTTHFK
jgi:hypothetical protein